MVQETARGTHWHEQVASVAGMIGRVAAGDIHMEVDSEADILAAGVRIRQGRIDEVDTGRHAYLNPRGEVGRRAAGALGTPLEADHPDQEEADTDVQDGTVLGMHSGHRVLRNHPGPSRTQEGRWDHASMDRLAGHHVVR